MIQLVQIQHPVQGRRVAVVEEERLLVLQEQDSAYSCAWAALQAGERFADWIAHAPGAELLDYEALYAGRSEWRLLPAFDHPEEPARCLVSGTGLTHRKSADNRHAMHRSDSPQPEAMTDSMRIYAWGVEGGRPAPGTIGAQPEWFYKGCGTILRAHGEPLETPDYAEDGGEEAEIAGVYLVDQNGTPWRVGFALANEFSDHRMESRNYLYLAPSKLRTCALGPELLIGASFDRAQGTVRIERDGGVLWSQEIASGEANMVHTLANLEHHQFKYAAHRRPGDVHIHFFGTGGFSFGAGIRLEEGDVMVVSFEGYGRPLRNPVRIRKGPAEYRSVQPL
jgi:hypothetical protein